MSDSAWPSTAFEYGVQLLNSGSVSDSVVVLENVRQSLAGPPEAVAECSYWLGVAYTQVPDFERALDAFARGAALVKGHPPSELSADCCALAAEILDELDRPADAVPYLRSAIADFLELGDTDQAAACEEGLGVALSGIDDHEGALDSFLVAANRYLEHVLTTEAADCFYYAAETAVQLDRPQQVFDNATRALELDPEAAAIVRADRAYLQAIAAAEVRDAAAAAAAAETSRMLFESERRFENAADASSVLGSALRELGQVEPARAAYLVAFRWFIAADKTSDAGQALRNASDVAYQLGEIELTRIEVLEARRLFEIGGAEIDAVYCTQVLGVLHAELGDTGSATTELTRALQEYERHDMPGDAAECLDKLGDLDAAAGRTADAIAQLERAAVGYTADDRHIEAGDCHRRIAMIHMRAHDAGRADASLQRAVTAMLAAQQPDLAAEIAVARGALFDEIANYPAELAAYAQARALFHDAGDVAGVAWCDAQTATVKMVHGDPATAETLLVGAIEVLAARDPERAADARSFLVMVYFEQSDLDAVARQLPRIKEAANSPERHANWELCEGLYRYQRGWYRDASAILDDARRTFASLGQIAKAAQCVQMRAMCDYFLGRHSAAESGLVRSRAQFAVERRIRDVAAVDIQLGLAYSATGRFDDALAAYERALDMCRSLGLGNEILKATGNIGALYVKHGKPAEALGVLRTALPVLETAADTYQTAAFRNLLGAAEIVGGRPDVGKRLVRQARAFYDRDASYRWHVGACHLNLALAEMMERHFETALASFHDARTLFTELGLTVELAKCDFLAAVVLVDRSGIQGSGADLTTALELAVPAAFYIDSQRFQFASATTRVSWTKLNLEFRSLLLKWAAKAGDASLVADLVESSINSGTHTSRSATPADLVEPFDGSGTESESTTIHTSDDVLTHGVSTLISGAILPMMPPPRLRMPDGHLALGHAIDSASKRYGGSRPKFEVSVV